MVDNPRKRGNRFKLTHKHGVSYLLFFEIYSEFRMIPRAPTDASGDHSFLNLATEKGYLISAKLPNRQNGRPFFLDKERER
jgi:hypothetical protein